MANAFDTDLAATTEPGEIVAGDTLIWKRTDLGTDYANGTHALSYKARLEGTGATVITITASASGDDYLVSVAAGTTASYATGVYRWQAYITRTSDSARVTIDSGTFEVLPNRSANTADPRSHAKTMLDKIESVLSGRADGQDAARVMCSGSRG